MARLDLKVAFQQRWRLREAAEWMSLVISMIRRSTWEQVPFDERLTFAEDAVWSHRVIQRGWSVRYEGVGLVRR